MATLERHLQGKKGEEISPKAPLPPLDASRFRWADSLDPRAQAQAQTQKKPSLLKAVAEAFFGAIVALFWVRGVEARLKPSFRPNSARGTRRQTT